MPLSWMGQRIVRLLDQGLSVLASVVCVLGVMAGATAARADVDMDQFRKDVQWISSRVRTIGSDGYEQTAKYIEQRIGTLNANQVEWKKHDFPVYVPVTNSATLTLADGSKQTV